MRDFTSKQGKQFKFRRLATYDSVALYNYFESLSETTQKKFSPHPLTKNYATYLCHKSFENTLRFIIEDDEKNILGYFIIDFNLIHHEVERYHSYGIELLSGKDVLFAPCIADTIQNTGLGTLALNRIIEILREDNINSIVLLGGTREDNVLAKSFYEKFGFTKIGGYQSDVWNLDMQLVL